MRTFLIEYLKLLELDILTKDIDYYLFFFKFF